MQQAFDRVWHKGLLCKVKKCLPHPFYGILDSYLTERTFQVIEGDSVSTLNDISAGVPQGSVLGPVLYNIYTSDLPQMQNVTTATYADDTAILAVSNNPVVATQKLQESLDAVDEWLKKWRIKSSSTKSVQVTFTLRREECPPVKLDGEFLPQSDSVKYLGLHLDRRLTWKKHLQAKRQQLKLKYSSLYWLLGRNSKLSVDNKLLIYKTILKPIWTYGIQLWGVACRSNINIIQRLQNTILKHLTNAPWFIRNDEVHEIHQINTVMEEVKLHASRYASRLKKHPNELATQLTMPAYTKRLKRRDFMELGHPKS